MSVVLTWASGYTLQDRGFERFLKSRYEVMPDIPLYVFGPEFTDSQAELIKRYGGDLVLVEHTAHLARDRHKEFHDFIKNMGWEDSRVLLSDGRDVIFQRNPFAYKSMGTMPIYLVEEGIDGANHWFQQKEAALVKKTLTSGIDYQTPSRVVNSGIIYGRGSVVAETCLLNWVFQQQSDPTVTDQGPFNFLSEKIFSKDNRYKFTNPKVDQFCFTGEGAKVGEVPYKIIDGKVCNEQDQPYHLVHQWQSIPNFQ